MVYFFGREQTSSTADELQPSKIEPVSSEQSVPIPPSVTEPVPARRGLKWTFTEDESLREQCKQMAEITNPIEDKISELARLHERTSYAIKCRLFLMAQNDLGKNPTERTFIFRKYLLVEEEYDRWIKSRERVAHTKENKQAQKKESKRRIVDFATVLAEVSEIHRSLIFNDDEKTRILEAAMHGIKRARTRCLVIRQSA
jgi:hypothetical protein